ncbi:MAG TPA: IS1182 family transposase [Acidimicrobiales bacterium]|nr:IS1182 family transposase [Acidimicrobiales bacterium]
MALGRAKRQQRFDTPEQLLGDRLSGLYRFLADHGSVLFPDQYFADCYSCSVLGRPTVPARVMATTMLLQSHEGLSDREACDRLGCDLRWQAAAGVECGYVAFDPTSLVGMRNRLRASGRPRRLFEDTKAMAREAGVLADRARVVDSTPLYDAVATQDTVTQLRSAIRKLLRLLGPAELASRVRQALIRDDDYESPGKPPCDWEDPAARDELVDGLVSDVNAALGVLQGEELTGALRDAAELLAILAGQDVEQAEDGRFRIAERVAKDRVISTVDTEARHGHKSHNRQFDGFKSHLLVDPDSELIDEVAVTPANVSDREAIDDLLASFDDEPEKPIVFGDSAYADGDTLHRLEDKGYAVMARVPPATQRDGRYSKDDFRIDLQAGEVTCPAGATVAIRFCNEGSGIAGFGDLCASCPLQSRCTTAKTGRTITIHRHEQILRQHKADQQNEEWKQQYSGTRPKVERKIAHFVHKPWGGRRARTRGAARVLTDVVTRAAVANFARLGVLGVRWDGAVWARGSP